MAQVKNSSGINISRTQYLANGQTSTTNLKNTIFNGYVYNMSLEVGFNGEPSALTLNLALDRTLKNVKSNSTIIQNRKRDIQILNQLTSSSKQDKEDKGISSASLLVDDDFQIDETYIGINTSYNISIIDDSGGVSYQLKDFRIASYSISKKDDQKILTLVMRDLSFVLSKIYVAVLGQQVAIDDRSSLPAIIENLKINCPAINQFGGGTVKLNFEQNLHFAESKLANAYKNIVSNALDVLYDETKNSNKFNYVIIKGKQKTIENGYGAVIILGEEDFKDGPCNSSEALYSFKTLLAAMERLGINIAKTPLQAGLKTATTVDTRTLQDKSKGRIKRSYSGSLKDVLGQWCSEYAYSYVVDFTANNASVSSSGSTSALSSITIKGIDLSAPLSKETVLKTRLEMQALESTSQTNFIIRSEDFNYDLSRKNLKLYSSYYFKDAKDSSLSYERSLGDRDFYAIDLSKSFPQLFSNTSGNGYDFCGTRRTYLQVLTSAVLGKYSPRLRQIYNYSIGAYQAIGFLPLNSNLAFCQLRLSRDSSLVFQEAITKVLDIQADVLYDNLGQPMFDFYFGFFNPDLAAQSEKIESVIADFVGKHYWTDEIVAQEGSYSNDSYYANYQINTVPQTEKVYVDQLYRLPIFQEIGFLIAEINSLFNQNKSYFDAFGSFLKLREATEATCEKATASYQQAIGDLNRNKRFRFYQTRSSASYGAFEELIKDIQQIEYRIGNVADVFKIDLADIYSPIFKELSPVSLATLQAVVPVDLSTCALGSYKFGLLAGFRDNIFSFANFNGSPSFLNPIEFQNSIRDRCAAISQQIAQGTERNKLLNKQGCSKTILYSACVLPNESGLIVSNNSAEIQSASGPNVYKCQAIRIWRKFPPNAIVQANVNRTLVTTNGFITLNNTSLNSLLIQSIRNPVPTSITAFIGKQQYETIVLPSQQIYPIRLTSKTNSEIFLPFSNFIKGGIEDPQDLRRIIENDSFSLDLFVNNITPNVRELFGDQTTPSYQQSETLITTTNNNTPYVMDYQGYNDTASSAKYEFLSFNDFHKKLKDYYDSRNISLNQPDISYSVNLFCQSINSSLKNLLTVEKGLSKLNLLIGENGLNIQLEYRSLPAKALNVETLIANNKPNIKLINTNFLR